MIITLVAHAKIEFVFVSSSMVLEEDHKPYTMNLTSSEVADRFTEECQPGGIFYFKDKRYREDDGEKYTGCRFSGRDFMKWFYLSNFNSWAWEWQLVKAIKIYATAYCGYGYELYTGNDIKDIGKPYTTLIPKVNTHVELTDRKNGSAEIRFIADKHGKDEIEIRCRKQIMGYK